MTLTEEQLEALDFALEYLVDDPNDDRDSNLANSIRTIRAMINSSEHFTDASKMTGFDLERVRAWNERQKEILKEKFHCACGTCHTCGFSPDQMDEALAEIERLRSAIRTYREREESAFSEIEMKDEFLVRQNARIKELEDAHKRSGKKYAKIINELRSSVYANIPGLDVGKIGPDARPRSWQITEERMRAIRLSEELAWDCKVVDVLRAMLEEAL